MGNKQALPGQVKSSPPPYPRWPCCILYPEETNGCVSSLSCLPALFFSLSLGQRRQVQAAPDRIWMQQREEEDPGRKWNPCVCGGSLFLSRLPQTRSSFDSSSLRDPPGCSRIFGVLNRHGTSRFPAKGRENPGKMTATAGTPAGHFERV